MGKTPYPGLDPRSLVKILDAGERLSKPMNAACTEQRYACLLDICAIIHAVLNDVVYV